MGIYLVVHSVVHDLPYIDEYLPTMKKYCPIDFCLEEYQTFFIIFFFFLENCVDEESFRNLNENDLQQLVPQIGLRSKLRAKWKEYMTIKVPNT